MNQDHFIIQTSGRATIELTDQVQSLVGASQVSTGLCHIFCQHTSASLILCENCDPDVRRDLEHFSGEWVKDGNPDFHHDTEGPDDMPAHIRTIFSHSDITVPVKDGRLLLGTWQGIFLWEHRHHPHRRKIVVTVW